MSSSRPDLRFLLFALRLPWFPFITSSLIRGDYGCPGIVFPFLVHACLVGGGGGGGYVQVDKLTNISWGTRNEWGVCDIVQELRFVSACNIYIHVTSFLMARDPERSMFTAKRK